MVVMTTWTVYMSVLQFFSSSLADAQHLNVKVKFDSCQGMISVYGDFIQPYVSNRYDLSVVGLKLHSVLNFLIAESRTRNFLNHLVALHAVAFFRAHFQFEFVALFLPFEALLHAGNEIANSLDIK